MARTERRQSPRCGTSVIVRRDTRRRRWTGCRATGTDQVSTTVAVARWAIGQGWRWVRGSRAGDRAVHPRRHQRSSRTGSWFVPWVVAPRPTTPAPLTWPRSTRPTSTRRVARVHHVASPRGLPIAGSCCRSIGGRRGARRGPVSASTKAKPPESVGSDDPKDRPSRAGHAPAAGGLVGQTVLKGRSSVHGPNGSVADTPALPIRPGPSGGSWRARRGTSRRTAPALTIELTACRAPLVPGLAHRSSPAPARRRHAEAITRTG